MKLFNKNIVLMGVMGLILSAPTLAYDKNDEQTIKQDIAKMNHAMKNKNGQVFVEMMPEPVLKQMAKSLDMSLSDLKNMFASMATSMSDGSIKFKANLAKIEKHQSKTGRDYVFIPTTTTVDGEDIEGKMFGVKDKGKWSYITWQDRYKPMVQKAYPDIKKLP